MSSMVKSGLRLGFYGVLLCLLAALLGVLLIVGLVFFGNESIYGSIRVTIIIKVSKVVIPIA